MISTPKGPSKEAVRKALAALKAELESPAFPHGGQRPPALVRPTRHPSRTREQVMRRAPETVTADRLSAHYTNLRAANRITQREADAFHVVLKILDEIAGGGR